ncbi:dTDP-4-dehydrorhamnose reductase [Candidatus Sumerlaeota bacterium]|nr:dTDP-4-dehydrorhamnose reductase [Candidatus Sumerlaeota bacterium]
MPRKVLITGADGMLGTDVVAHLKSQTAFEVIPTTIHTMDITSSQQVRDVMLTHQPDVVIHCAAYTAVDKAEKEPDVCFAVNAEGTKTIATLCHEIDAEIIFISTDYVFDGKKKSPYVETDKPNPLNVYGASKLKGEEYVQSLVPRHKVVRTAWLNGVHCTYGTNFIEAILKNLASEKTVSVVSDQYGTPTFTFHLAEALALLLDVDAYGIFHITNQGICSWYEFACAIVEEFGLKGVTVKPIKGSQFRSLATRPENSALENARLKELNLPLLPHWREGLAEYHRRRKTDD